MENPRLYEIARQINHEFGFDWTDPRTGVTHKAPPENRPRKKRKPRRALPKKSRAAVSRKK